MKTELAAIIFIKNTSPLKEFAYSLYELLDTINCKIEEREGLNIGGGVYYRLTFFGLTINIINNRGEVFHDDYSDYPTYLAISGLESNHEPLFLFALKYFEEILKTNRFNCRLIYPY